MKKGKKHSNQLLNLAPLCACFLALASFVLLMTTQALVHDYEVLGAARHDYYSATALIFGNGQHVTPPLTLTFEGNASWTAVLAWIFTLVATGLLALSTVAAFIKAKSIIRFAGLIALVAAGLLIAAGVFVLVSKSTFYAANGYNYTNDGYVLGIGWIIAIILAFSGSLLSILPSVAALVTKK